MLLFSAIIGVNNVTNFNVEKD